MKKNVPNVNLLFIGTVSMCGCLQTYAQKSITPQHPNIIYIMSDDHSYQTISAYGSKVSQLAPTPNIDRIANEGIRFDRAFVENSLSAPSRACTITGLYSNQNGQRQLFEGIDTNRTFVSETLHAAGYQTGVVGKWHLMCEPKGFDYYNVLDDQGKYYNPTFKSKATKGQYVQEMGYATDLITKHALEFLDHRDKSRPFFLMVHHKAPHRNWMPDLKNLGIYDKIKFPLPETFWDDYETRGLAAHSQKMSISKSMEMIQDLKVFELLDTASIESQTSYNALMGDLGRLTPEQRVIWDKYYGPVNGTFLRANLNGKELVEWKYQRYLHDYLSVIHSIDESVGELLSYLEKNNLLNNTIIIYTSDQGFYMGEHNWFDKRFMYEESMRTPLMIRYPQAIKPHTVSTALVQNIDYVPTFLELAGIKKDKNLPGISLVPLFNNGDAKHWRTSLYYHYYDYPAFHMVRRHDGVRTDRYKLIHFYGNGGLRAATSKYQTTPGYRENAILNYLVKSNYIQDAPDVNYNELYDLAKDPNELHNVYGKPGYEKITKNLQQTLDKYRKDLKIDEY
jgi:arylsulfatase A-like enzyme